MLPVVVPLVRRHRVHRRMNVRVAQHAMEVIVQHATGVPHRKGLDIGVSHGQSVRNQILLDHRPPASGPNLSHACGLRLASFGRAGRSCGQRCELRRASYRHKTLARTSRLADSMANRTETRQVGGGEDGTDMESRSNYPASAGDLGNVALAPSAIESARPRPAPERPQSDLPASSAFSATAPTTVSNIRGATVDSREGLASGYE